MRQFAVTFAQESSVEPGNENRMYSENNWDQTIAKQEQYGRIQTAFTKVICRLNRFCNHTFSGLGLRVLP